MAYVLFWAAGLLTVGGSTLFTLARRPNLRLLGMGATFLGFLGLLAFWSAPALFCLLFLVGVASTLSLLIFAGRLFPPESAVLSSHYTRHFVTALAIWGFSFVLQRGISGIPVGAFRTAILAPDSDALFSVLTGGQSVLVVLIVIGLIIAGSAVRRLGDDYPVGGRDDVAP